MNCPTCSAELAPGSTVCSRCGTSLSGGGAAAAAVPAQAAGLSDNAIGAIAYITVLPPILFLILDPYKTKPFVRFHSFQSIGLTAVAIACWIVAFVITAMSPLLMAIPGVGSALAVILIPLGIILFPLIGVFFFIVWLITILKASKGAWFKLPFIGKFALARAKS